MGDSVLILGEGVVVETYSPLDKVGSTNKVHSNAGSYSFNHNQRISVV